jgi:hypothetical protein
MHKRILTLALVTFTSIVHANTAGLFVEPMLTYERGESDIDYPTPFGSSSGDVTGFGVGGRVGFHVLESLFIGADARYSKPAFDNDDPDFKTDATAYNYGPVVGVQMPTLLGLRVWGSYVMSGEMDLEEKNDVDLKLKEASGSTNNVDAEVKSYIASVSFPISL